MKVATALSKSSRPKCLENLRSLLGQPVSVLAAVRRAARSSGIPIDDAGLLELVDRLTADGLAAVWLVVLAVLNRMNSMMSTVRSNGRSTSAQGISARASRERAASGPIVHSAGFAAARGQPGSRRLRRSCSRYRSHQVARDPAVDPQLLEHDPLDLSGRNSPSVARPLADRRHPIERRERDGPDFRGIDLRVAADNAEIPIQQGRN